MGIKIADLLPVKQTVKVSEGNFLPVGPVGIEGLTSIMVNHKEPLLQLIAGSANGTPDLIPLLKEAPEMLVALIAQGADAVGQEEDIKKLPAGVQLEAAAMIWQMSVPDAKKTIDLLSTVLGQLKPTPVPLAKPVEQVTSAA